MKKLLALLLAVLMLAALCACGEAEETPAVEAQETVAAADAAVDGTGDLDPAPATDASGSDTYVLTNDSADGAVNEEKYALALECVGESVDVLYDAIGEPEVEPHYASSCLELGAQDGQHYYDTDGFYVTTLKNDDGETVMGVIRYD